MPLPKSWLGRCTMLYVHGLQSIWECCCLCPGRFLSFFRKVSYPRLTPVSTSPDIAPGQGQFCSERMFAFQSLTQNMLCRPHILPYLTRLSNPLLFCFEILPLALFYLGQLPFLSHVPSFVPIILSFSVGRGYLCRGSPPGQSCKAVQEWDFSFILQRWLESAALLCTKGWEVRGLRVPEEQETLCK